MKTTCVTLCAFTLFALSGAFAFAGDNVLSAEEQNAGYRLLFDGVSTNGWFPFRPETAKGAWVVEDGCLTPKGKSHELATNEVFGDFELRFDWKIAPGGNSGVLYRVEKGFHPPTSGPEFQLLDNKRHKVGGMPLHQAGAVYAIYPPTSDPGNPAGEWNTARIIAKGNHIEHWLNGTNVCDYELGSADWKARVGKSKFAKHPQYGVATKGHILIQEHGAPIWFKNVRIREF